jgi:hypothetical protein
MSRQIGKLHAELKIYPMVNERIMDELAAKAFSRSWKRVEISDGSA